MSATHSPGPWTFEPLDEDTKRDPEAEIPDGCSFWITETRHAGEVVALMLDTSNGTQEANARLIAAAPELLDALKGMVGLIQLIQAREPDLPRNHRFVAALELIAKAEGVTAEGPAS
jgi:hypothetical protein